MPESLTIGSNKIVSITVKDKDGVDLPLTSLLTLKVIIKQYNRILSTLNYKPGVQAPELTLGSGPAILNVEITKEISSKFKEGDVYARLYSEETDALFVVDGAFNDQPEQIILTAIL